tara:strand:+ start:317 stop:544 length:228 start_codon:yes stop_codon:yes gene_type:complete
MRKKPRVDLKKVGHKDKERIDRVLSGDSTNESKKKYLKMCIEIYIHNSNKLIAVEERDHYMQIQRYCEQKLKELK